MNRRTFLRSVAALPIAARLDALLPASSPRVAVIGAGAFGGWIALQLRRLGAQVTLLDAWGPGNARSSSGGETRVIRAVYGADRIYVEMVKRAYELWEWLDATTDESLYTETGALWMHRGDDAYVRSAVPILAELGFPVEKISEEDAYKRWRQIDFSGVKSIWFEKRAGVLSARRACAVVRDAFVRLGGVHRIAHVQPGKILKGRLEPLHLYDGVVEADVYVFACGPWLGKLFPLALGDRIRPSRQEVYFFGTPERSFNQYAPPHLPVWIDFGERIFYGAPDTHGRGFKIADDTRGEDVDPTTLDRTPSAQGIARARRVLGERFRELANAPLLESRVCQYENSPDGHLILDRYPDSTNVWIAGGGSGHGFKLAPAVGELMANAILTDNEIPALFRLERLRDEKQPKTQFDEDRHS